MEIKRSSWHYKIGNFGRDFERSNDNLCRYFWRLVGKLILLLAATVILSVLGYTFFTSGVVILTTILSVFILSVIILPVWAIYFIRKRFGKSPEMPYGNIVTEYLAAKKRKVCPLIVYK